MSAPQRTLHILNLILCLVWLALAHHAHAQPHMLDPQRAVTTADHVLSRAVYMGLVTRDADGHIVPGLAKSWLISADGLSYRFQLHDDLRWSDGQRIDASDIVANFKRALDPATAAPFYRLLMQIKNAEAFRSAILPTGTTLGVTAPDADTVLIELGAPSHKFLGILAEPVAMLSSAVHSVVVPEGAFTPQPNPNGARFLYQLLINVTHAPLDQRDVRHALGMVIDRSAIVTQLGFQNSTEAYGFQDAPTASQAPYARIPPQDRKTVASALLLDLKRDTAPLRIVVPQQTMHLVVADALAKSWTALGLRVNIEALPVEAYERALLAGEFDVAWAPLRSPPWPADQAREQMLFMFSKAAGPWNMGQYNEPVFDQFLANADADITPAHRASQWRSAESVLIEDQAAFPLFFYSATIPTANDVMGKAIHPAIIHR